MADTPRGSASSGQWVWTVALASIAFLLVGYLLVILIGGAYSNFVEGHPFWGVEVLLLAAVPFVVGAEMYRRGNRNRVSTAQHIRAISAALILVGLILAVIGVFLSGPI